MGPTLKRIPSRFSCSSASLSRDGAVGHYWGDEPRARVVWMYLSSEEDPMRSALTLLSDVKKVCGPRVMYVPTTWPRRRPAPELAAVPLDHAGRPDQGPPARPGSLRDTLQGNVAARTRAFGPPNHAGRRRGRADLRPDHVHDRRARTGGAEDAVLIKPGAGEDAGRLEGDEHPADPGAGAVTASIGAATRSLC